MSLRMRDVLMSSLGQLRHEPTAKRIRAKIAAGTIVDTTRAALLWEPGRIVPSYAVPIEDVHGELVPAAAATAEPQSARAILDPSVPFGVHTADGEALDLQADGHHRPGAGFRLADPDLAGYVVLDFGAFDAWYEEDELNVGHPRDPFHRIDVLVSSRPVRLEVDGEVLADSTRPTLLFETMMPTRYYLPPDDVRAELTLSETRTYCAYKGQASYWSCTLGERRLPDLAWSYERPLHDALKVRGLVAFFGERVDVVISGQRQQRPVTRWSSSPAS